MFSKNLRLLRRDGDSNAKLTKRSETREFLPEELTIYCKEHEIVWQNIE